MLDVSRTAGLGLHLRRVRTEKGLTLDRLASLSELTRGYISLVERGLKVPSIAALLRLAKALDVNVAYRQACLNAIEYLKKFGYSGAQAYSILGTAPCQGHISGVVDVPNACATLWLPTEIFDFDIMPSSAGPIKHIKGDIQMPLSPDK